MPVERSESVTAPARPPDRGARLTSLVVAAQEGSEDALGQIVTELSPMLWQVARSAGLASPEAEDVLQTVWLRLVGHLSRLRTPTALTAWLVITTRREAWRVRAARRRQVCADQDWLTAIPDPAPGAEQLAIASDRRRELWAALAQLSPRCQELLRIIAFVPQADYQAIAAQLGMPQGSIGPTRGRCLAKLRALLAGSLADPGEGTLR
jgi:RNA polymerase sigma factor (sigma-70 family)